MKTSPIQRDIYMGQSDYDVIEINQYNRQIPIVFALYNADGTKHMIQRDEYVRVELNIGKSTFIKITGFEYEGNKVSFLIDREWTLNKGTGTMTVITQDTNYTLLSSATITIVVKETSISEETIRPEVMALFLTDIQDVIVECQAKNEEIKAFLENADEIKNSLSDSVTEGKAMTKTINTYINKATNVNSTLNATITKGKTLDANLSTSVANGQQVYDKLSDNIANGQQAYDKLDTIINNASAMNDTLAESINRANDFVNSLNTLLDLTISEGKIYVTNNGTAIGNGVLIAELIEGAGKLIDSLEATYTGGGKSVGSTINKSEITVTVNYSDGTSAVVQNWTSSNFTTPLVEGDNVINISFNGENTTVTVVAYLPPTIISFTTDKTSPQKSGGKVTLTVEATGEGTLQYKFLVKDNTTESSAVLRDYGTSNIYEWTTKSTGNKTLYVDVKDSNGQVTRGEIFYTITE